MRRKVAMGSVILKGYMGMLATVPVVSFKPRDDQEKSADVQRRAAAKIKKKGKVNRSNMARLRGEKIP